MEKSMKTAPPHFGGRGRHKDPCSGYIIFKTGEDSYTLSFNVLIRGVANGTQVINVKNYPEDLSQKKAYAPPDITELGNTIRRLRPFPPPGPPSCRERRPLWRRARRPTGIP